MISAASALPQVLVPSLTTDNGYQQYQNGNSHATTSSGPAYEDPRKANYVPQMFKDSKFNGSQSVQTTIKMYEI